MANVDGRRRFSLVVVCGIIRIGAFRSSLRSRVSLRCDSETFCIDFRGDSIGFGRLDFVSFWRLLKRCLLELESARSFVVVPGCLFEIRRSRVSDASTAIEILLIGLEIWGSPLVICSGASSCSRFSIFCLLEDKVKCFVKMNLENDNLSRCVRHPAQLFTGFCPTCLVERLSNVGTSEQSVEEPRNTVSEIVEGPGVVPDVKSKTSEIRNRKTLQYLFQLDDDLDVDRTIPSVPDKILPSTSNACEFEICSNGGNCSKDANIKISSCGGTKMMENDANSYEEITISAYIAKEISDSKKRKQKDGGVTLWLKSIFAKKGFSWRTRSISKKQEMPDGKTSCVSEDNQSESNPNLQQSRDWMLCHNSSKNSWDPPRHSWDGSMVSRALACSFSCLEEHDHDLTRIKRDMHDETTGKCNQTIDGIGRCKVTANAAAADEKSISSDGNIETLSVERLYEASQPGDSVSRIRGKKSRRLSKVWDWNIGNSFRDLVKKRDHILERSASETWHGRKSTNVESIENSGASQSSGSGQGSFRVNHGTCRSMNAANADMKIMRSEWRMKNEFKLGRSRSVHYSSPGNLDYGLLRFYLTPLRSSRRSTSKVRRKNTHYFGRGIFGLS